MPHVNNVDIVDLTNRVWLCREECLRASQQGSSSVNEPDQIRLSRMLDTLDAQVEHIEKTPWEKIDLPHTLNVDWPIHVFSPTSGLPMPENAAMSQIVRLFDLMGMDLSRCGSRKLAGGLHPDDSIRLKALSAKIRDYLEDFIKENHPIDMPQIEGIESYQPGEST